MACNSLDSISSGFPPFWEWLFSEPFSFIAASQIAELARIDRLVEERSRREATKSSGALGSVSSARADYRSSPWRAGFGSFPDGVQYFNCACGDDAGCDRCAANDADHCDRRARHFGRLDYRAL